MSEAAKESRAIALYVEKMSENNQKPLTDFIVPLYHSNRIAAGSTDVGDVSWQTPTAQIQAAAWPAGVPGHSWQIVSFGKSEMAHDAMLCAGKVRAAAAIDLMTEEKLLAAAKEEFAERSVGGYVCPIEPDAIPVPLF